MQTFRFGAVQVDIRDGFTVTSFDDGGKVWALHAEQPGQRQTAQHIGCSVEEMNQTHDLVHSMLAQMLGLDYSPALYAVAHGQKSIELHDAEEDAVKAIQRFAVMARSDALRNLRNGF
jgi:hypothetical protein